MRLLTSRLVAMACVAVVAQACTNAQGANDAMKLQRVVVLMRHGIRPPTKANPLPAGYTAKPWPKWDADPGLLTARGATGVALLGQADRLYYAKQGLVTTTGCPAKGDMVVMASAKQRAIATAESYLAAFAPECGVTVDHPPVDGADPIFHGLDDQPAAFDGHAAFLEAQKLIPQGGLAAEAAQVKPVLQLLDKVLGCCEKPACVKAGLPDKPCGLEAMPTALVEATHDRPELEGPLDAGSTASQSFLLEYLEGMPMADVAWGQLSRAQIESLLVFHPLKFKYSNRSAYIANRAAAAIVQRMLDAVTAPADGARITLLVGHDTNLADVGGFFDTHWKVDSYPTDDIPPGGAFGLEIWANGKGQQFVRAFFRAQTMDQLRDQVKFSDSVQPYRAYIALPECGMDPCPLETFVKTARARIVPVA